MRQIRLDGRAMEDHELSCPDCGDSMALMKDRNFVGYKCRTLECRGSHGAHRGGKPLGTPADATTRKARIEAHAVFDRLWESKKITRDRAYAWMRQELCLNKEECHIGSFDVATCKRLVQRIREAYPDLFPFNDLNGL
jgi:hypothetical protein